MSVTETLLKSVEEAEAKVERGRRDAQMGKHREAYHELAVAFGTLAKVVKHLLRHAEEEDNP